MLDGVISLLSYQASSYLNAGVSPGRLGNRHPTIAPYDTFDAADGEFFLAVGNDAQFRRLCDVIGDPNLAMNAAYATNPARVMNYAALRTDLTAYFSRRPRREWIATLTGAGVPCGAVREIPEVLADPQVLARHMIEVVEHVTAGTVKVLGVPISLSETPGTVRTAPPVLGQHTDLVLKELDVPADAIARLREQGVI
jgi:crotonobetainyl-CoA:carnitine CoA-transferase CaiB-like acyl-CoA transferase